MDCSRIRTAISAWLDGEDTGLDAATVTSHVASCVRCQAFEREATKIHQAARLGSAPIVPDLTPQILAALGDVERERSPVQALRVALTVIAVVQIGLAAPGLLLGQDAGLPVHTARHLGAFAIALGVGFFVAAWRPDRVAGVFPIAAAVVVCLLVSSFIDVAAGNAATAGELSHGPELIGLVGLWLLSKAGGDTPSVRTVVA